MPKKVTKPPEEAKPVDALEMQYRLPTAEQRKLIVIPATMRPDNALVELAVGLARSARIPLWGVNLIPTRAGVRPYVNADGIRFRLANDPRGIASNTSEVLQMPNGRGSLVVVRRTITMRTGEIYQGLGAVVVDDQWNPANSLLKADTKANRRAGYDAIANAVGMPMYDEDAERGGRSQEAEVLDAAYRVVGETPHTIGQLLKRLQDEGITDEDFKRVAGYEVAELQEKDVVAIWDKLIIDNEARKP